MRTTGHQRVILNDEGQQVGRRHVYNVSYIDRRAVGTITLHGRKYIVYQSNKDAAELHWSKDSWVVAGMEYPID